MVLDARVSSESMAQQGLFNDSEVLLVPNELAVHESIPLRLDSSVYMYQSANGAVDMELSELYAIKGN